MKPERPALDRAALGLLALALLIRLFVAVVVFADAPPESDQAFYLETGQQLWRFGIYPESLVPGYDKATEISSVGPGYPVFVALFVPQTSTSINNQRLSATSPRSPEALRTEITVIRVAQALLDSASALLVYWIAGSLFDLRVARLALLAQALDLRYVFQAGFILTETLYIFLILSAMWAYLRGLSRGRMLDFALAGLALAWAALVRPTALLFPLGLLLHAILAGRKQALRAGAILLVSYSLLVVPYIIRSSLVVGSFVPISSTGATHLWLASEAEGQEIGAATFATQRAEAMGTPEPTEGDFTSDVYVGAATANVFEQGLNYLFRIGWDTLTSLLQPYGTGFLAPATELGVRDLLLAALRGERRWGEVISAPALARRLWIYALHYWGLIFGTAGSLMALRERRIESWVLPGWIVYTVLVSAFLLIEPRYLFPMSFALSILAAYASLKGWEWFRARRPKTQEA